MPLLTHLCRPVRSTFAVRETGAPIMPRDAVSRTASVERTGRHKWVNLARGCDAGLIIPINNPASLLEDFHDTHQIFDV